MKAEDLRNRFKQDTGKTPYLKSTSEGFHVARREYANWLESKLQSLKEEVEKELKKAEHFNNGDGSADDHFWRGRKNQCERFLNLITNLEDNE